MNNEQKTQKDSLNIGGLIIHKSDNGLYSLRDLWISNGKRKRKEAFSFTRLSSTKEIVNELRMVQKSGLDSPISVSDILITIKGGTNRGTYACKELCYIYASWLSPSFHLQVIRAFDELLNAQTDGQVLQLKS